jgi:hypothetical protein
MIVSEHRDPHGTRLRNWDRNANTFKDTHLAGAAVTMDAIDWVTLKNQYVNQIAGQVVYAVSQAHYPDPAGGMKEPPNDPANVTIDGQSVVFRIRWHIQACLFRLALFHLTGDFPRGGIAQQI